MVVRGNLTTHVSRAREELVAARDWLTVFWLPPYAHELNPIPLASLAKRGQSLLAEVRMNGWRAEEGVWRSS